MQELFASNIEFDKWHDEMRPYFSHSTYWFCIFENPSRGSVGTQAPHASGISTQSFGRLQNEQMLVCFERFASVLSSLLSCEMKRKTFYVLFVPNDQNTDMYIVVSQSQDIQNNVQTLPWTCSLDSVHQKPQSCLRRETM